MSDRNIVKLVILDKEAQTVHISDQGGLLDFPTAEVGAGEFAGHVLRKLMKDCDVENERASFISNFIFTHPSQLVVECSVYVVNINHPVNSDLTEITMTALNEALPPLYGVGSDDPFVDANGRLFVKTIKNLQIAHLWPSSGQMVFEHPFGSIGNIVNTRVQVCEPKEHEDETIGSPEVCGSCDS